MIALLFMSMLAVAQAWTGKICAKYDVSYSDAVIGDNWVNEDFRWARGALIVVYDTTINEQTYNSFAAESGNNLGCITATLTNGHAYRVTLHAIARVNGNFIRVWDDLCDYGEWDEEDEEYSEYPSSCPMPPPQWMETPGHPTPPPYAFVLKDNLVTSIHTAPTLTYYTLAHDVWNIAAAAGYAQFRETGGESGRTYRFRLKSSASGSRFVSDGRLEVDGGSAGRKFTIAHELGHAIANYSAGLTAGHQGWSSAGPDPGDRCISMPTQRGAGLTRRNYNAMALVEATAHHYANLVWNNPGEANDPAEMLNTRNTDWNLRGPDDVATAADWISDAAGAGSFSANGCQHCFGLTPSGIPATCPLEGEVDDDPYDYTAWDGGSCYNWYLEPAEVTGPNNRPIVRMKGYIIPMLAPYSSSAPDEDYLDFCHTGSANTNLTLHNRATQLDYARFLWAMREDKGMSLQAFLDIVDASDPEDWYWNAPNASVNRPANRLRQIGILAYPNDWDDYTTDHGVHR